MNPVVAEIASRALPPDADFAAEPFCSTDCARAWHGVFREGVAS